MTGHIERDELLDDKVEAQGQNSLRGLARTSAIITRARFFDLVTFYTTLFYLLFVACNENVCS
ncbi:hypothetical protein GGTG_05978 [Gaeumannomyces tritici R3-111a-1]|uniref:Uncharacterized protein n=1 Tax=Gaeumannomyces tritici (strain R3-111a-1) TaxID=644352 RepID=J3NXH2_GAET3|nr:hypothetical protein GGTG_05978 [Gaeumannomyces tritici R3-111a-1]EJT76054.1 hypothetical protein GGTG_05978 [Gaeumannomyces tritici R3-111a-1]